MTREELEAHLSGPSHRATEPIVQCPFELYLQGWHDGAHGRVNAADSPDHARHDDRG